jgi:predicted amidohydrolase
VGPDGILRPTYRKTHLFEADPWWAEPGNTGFLQWESPWGSVGSGICMDLNYPDLVEFHRDAGTTILAFSTNWLDQDADVIPYWEDRLAGIEGRGFEGTALFANRGGAEFGVRYRGQSAIFRQGRVVASLSGKGDGVLVTDLGVPDLRV